jgi:hypothetical protein
LPSGCGVSDPSLTIKSESLCPAYEAFSFSVMEALPVLVQVCNAQRAHVWETRNSNYTRSCTRFRQFPSTDSSFERWLVAFTDSRLTSSSSRESRPICRNSFEQNEEALFQIRGSGGHNFQPSKKRNDESKFYNVG